MIGYCPIEFDEPPPLEKPRVPVMNKEPDVTTECNYVVMFFIVGVIALAAMDAVKK